MAGQTIQVSVLADTKQFSRAMRGLADQSGLSKLGTMAKTAGKAVAVGLGAGAVAAGAFAVKAVGAASDLQQSIGGLDAVFKDQAGQMHDWAKAAAQTTGLSRNSYNELATSIGTTLKNAGIPMDQLGGKTNDLLGLSADLAATFGGPVTQSAGAMSSALRGEFEPLRAYGVSLNQAAINARAMADSGKTNADSLTLQEKALATQALIYEQTADAQGAFARESNTLAGQQERLKAKLENIAATAGTYLLPALTAIATWVSDRVGPAFESLTSWIQTSVVPALQTFGAWAGENLLPKLRELGDWITGTLVPALQTFGTFLTGTVVPGLQQAATWVQQNSAWLIPLAIALGSAAVAYMAVTKVMAIWKAAVIAAKAAQVALNLAMTANPIGIIIALVVGLVAAIVYLWKNNEGFRTAVLKVWDAIKTGIGNAVRWVQDRIAELGTIPGKVGAWFTQTKERAVLALQLMLAFVTSLPGRITSGLSSMASRLYSTATGAVERFRSGMVTKFDAVVSWVRGIPERVVSALGNVGSKLLGAGRSIIDGFLTGIREKFDNVRETLGNLTSLLPDWKGPAKRDRSLLRGNGRLVIEGFVRGLRDRFGAAKRTLTAFTSDLADLPVTTITPKVVPELAALPGAGSARYGAAARVYHIEVKALQPGPEVGRAVVESIEQFERLNGGDRR